MTPAKLGTVLPKALVAAAYLRPDPREGLCPLPGQRPSSMGTLVSPGSLLPGPAGTSELVLGCQDLQAPPAYSPAVPEPPP